MYFVSLHLCHIQIHCVRQIIQICNQIIIDHIIIYLFTCLDEYVTVMQPVALALDKLQGQNDVFFGHILPTLYTVQVKLTGMQQKALKHSEVLVKTLLEGLAKRFDKELSFSSGDKIIAAVTHPFFKLRWLPEDKREQCRQLFIEAVKKLDVATSASGHSYVSTSLHDSTEDDFVGVVCCYEH